MPVFLALAALLTLLTLALLLRPLWPGHRTLLAVIALVIVIGSTGLYMRWGTPLALDPAMRAQPQTIDQAIAQLKARLERAPKEGQGWYLLGQALAGKGDASGARDAYAKAAALLPDQPDVLVAAAEARALAGAEHRIDPQAMALLQQALKVDPKHQRARWFVGIAQRQSGQAAAAATTWEGLLADVDARTGDALRPQIDAARADAGLPPLPKQAAPSVTPIVTVQVSQATTLPPDTTVFVIARQAGGPPMPVAVKKLTLAELPVTLRLSDADSLMPTRKLSQVGEVELLVRLSRSGNAMQGDAESAPVRVTLPSKAPIALHVAATP